MQKSINSQPGAGKYRSTVVIIIVLICMVSFFTFTENLGLKSELIARDRVISDIKYSLSMMLYDYSIKGRPQDLQKFDHENPFVLLAIYRQLPNNYHGVVSTLKDIQPGWYFDKSRKEAVFFSSTNVVYPDISLQMRYQKEKTGDSGDGFGRLVIRGSE